MHVFNWLALPAAFGLAVTLPSSAFAAETAVGLADAVAYAIAALGLGAAAFALAHFFRLRRRVAALAAAARAIALEASPDSAPAAAADDVEAALTALRVVDAAAAKLARLRDKEAERRIEAEVTLRETEERYALAVRGANDGMWEWDLRSDTVHYSPRWISMLGYDEADVGSRLEEWLSRIHPDDRDRVRAALEAHLAGQTTRFDVEHRLRQRDGTYRWVLARASAICNAGGRPYRMVGLNTDITARHQAQDTLIQLADALSGLRGEEFFRALVRSLVTVLNTREAFIAECIDFPTTQVRMLAHWNRGDFARCPEFELAGTSCQRVIAEGKPLYVPRNLGDQFPLEKNYDREAYLGLPCFDSEGRVIGHIACADGRPMPQDLPNVAILRLFAVRAALELERRLLSPAPAASPAAHILH
jgi:PAS domain S-box-containing protein